MNAHGWTDQEVWMIVRASEALDYVDRTDRTIQALRQRWTDARLLMNAWVLAFDAAYETALARARQAFHTPVALAREDEDMQRRLVTNIARLTILAIVLLTGCATIRTLQARDTEELLTAAGFKKQLVDAADTTPLDAGPPYRLVSRTKDGTVLYTYADPDNCRCVYLGGSKEYAEYRRLATERRLDDERRRAAEDVWDRHSWGIQSL